MCVITTTALATGGTALSLGVGSASVGLGTVGSLSLGALGTISSSVIGNTIAVLGSAAMGAGMSAGVAAIGGSSNIGLAAGIGAVGGALASGIGSAFAGTDKALELTATPQTAEQALAPASTGGQGIADAVAAGNVLDPSTAVQAGQMTAQEAQMSNEVAQLMTTGSLPLSGGDTVVKGGLGGTVSTAGEGMKVSTAELLAKGAIAAGAGIAMGTMSYQSALRAAEAQARAQEDQAKQMDLAGDLAEQNAKNARLKAGMEMESGELDAADKARISRQEAGSAITKAAGSGVMIEPRKESMTTMLEADQKAELVYDQAKIMQNAQMRAWGYLAEERNYDYEALGQRYGAAGFRSAARETRRAGKVNAWTSAFGSGLSTGASVGSLLI